MADLPSIPGHEGGLSSGNQDFWRLVAENDSSAIAFLQGQMQLIARYYLLRGRTRPGLIRQEFEELTQNAWLELMRHVGVPGRVISQQPADVLKTFIRKAWRKRKRDHGEVVTIDVDDERLFGPADELSIELDKQEPVDIRWESIATALERDLRPNCQELIRLAYYENLDHKAIGELLGRPTDGVKGQLKRCRNYLRVAALAWLEKADPVAAAAVRKLIEKMR